MWVSQVPPTALGRSEEQHGGGGGDGGAAGGGGQGTGSLVRSFKFYLYFFLSHPLRR